MRILNPLCACWLAACGSAHAIILFGLDNSANQTDPETGVPFDAVARLSNTAGTSLGGSAVHIGAGWMITANHVNPFDSATFDGTTFYHRDTSTPTVQLGTSDMKLFRLTATPTVGAANIYTGSAETTAAATIVGWGRGRDPSVPVGSNTVAWSGSDSTSAKRWGLNRPAGLTNAIYSSYNFESIYTILGSSTGSPSGLGENEAAMAMLDSGGGMFQQIDGIWYLIGIAVAVETANSSFFGNDAPIDGRGNANFFARVSTYSDDVFSITGITGIPEPSIVFLAGIGLLAMCGYRHRDRG